MADLAELWGQVSRLNAGAELSPVRNKPGKWVMRLGGIETGPGEAEDVVAKALRIAQEEPKRLARPSGPPPPPKPVVAPAKPVFVSPPPKPKLLPPPPPPKPTAKKVKKKLADSWSLF